MYSNTFFGVYLKIKPFIMLKHKFKYTLLPFFYTITLLFFASCGKEETNTKNHLPVATFEANTYRGDVNTVFQFDASMVRDEEDPVELLEIKWNWSNDANYDTEYSTTKTASHQYSEIGLYFPTVKVRDTKGMIDSLKKMVVVVLDLNNQPPDKPQYISPEDWSKYIQPTNVFKWSCTDPESDSLTFDLWLGERETILLPVKRNISTFETTLEDILEYKKGYFWQIYARDVAGNYTAGDIWRFTTAEPPSK